MSPVGSTRRFWETRASGLAFRLNVAAWLERFGPAFFAVTSVGAVALYSLRRLRGPVDWVWIALGASVAVAALVVAWFGRRRYFSATEAQVLLESRLRLDTRLTAAAGGLVDWPPEPKPFPSIVQWRLRASASWISGAALLVLLAAAMPVPALTTTSRPTDKPPSLAETEALLAALAEAKVADAAAVEQMTERARELANRRAEEQYSHSALEAADALRDQATAAVAALGRNLEAASNAVRSSAENPSSKSAADRLSTALSGLRESSLPANSGLMKQLGDGSALKNLSADQLKSLAQQLSNAAQGAKGVLGAAGAGAGVARGELSWYTGRPGSGGLGGGTTGAPLVLLNAASNAGDGKAEALSASSLANISLGDKLGTSSGAHEVDPTKAVGAMSAGGFVAPAKGGEAVWVNRLTPTERAALKDFYK